MKLKKGDRVQVIAGKDRGKQGEISRVFPANERILVKGVNMVKRHIRPKQSGQKGERVDREGAIHVSNVMLLDPSSGKPTKVGYRTEGDEKMRFAKKSGKTL